MADNSYDVIVLGSGPGGYLAACNTASLGEIN
jgi:dihydrolipoamide dehydrogenase